MALLLALTLGLGLGGGPVEARKKCGLRSCKRAIKARCVGLKRKARRMCKKGVLTSCRRGECMCKPVATCAEPPTTTVVTTSSTTSSTLGIPSTTTTTLVSGACLVDLGDGTIHDTCTGLQWEKKEGSPGLHDVTVLYSWAGCCNSDCSSLANLCQPNAEAAATCAAKSDGGTQGCSTCAVGTCDVDPEMSGVPTTVWDWLNQLNASGYAGHDDWRLPSQAGDNVSPGATELESIVDPNAVGCGLGAPCIDPIFGATVADAYFSATTITSTPSMVWGVDFSAGNVGSGTKQSGFYIRAVR